jgi:hypothetical protein
MASERVTSFEADHASMVAIISSGRRTWTPGSLPPVGGRPRLFDATLIDFAIIDATVKASRGEAPHFRPGSNPQHDEA